VRDDHPLSLPQHVRETSPYQSISALISNPPPIQIQKFGHTNTSPFSLLSSKNLFFDKASTFFDLSLYSNDTIPSPIIQALVPYTFQKGHDYYLNINLLPAICLSLQDIFLFAMYTGHLLHIGRLLASWEVCQTLHTIFQVSLFFWIVVIFR